jgi:enoyl-CoA hydratase/carnithine racemase
MAIISWKTERNKRVSKVTIEVEGPPVISLQKYIELVNTLITEVNRPDVGAVLLTSPMEKFIFGLDISEIAKLNTAKATRGDTGIVKDLLYELEKAPKALICAIDGTCFGGGLELILVFHIILATPSSTFGLPEIKIGTIPSFGGTQRLPRIIGRNRALKLMLTGETFSAKVAMEWGLVTDVIPRDNLINYAQILAEQLSSLSRPAIRALLTATLDGLDGSMLRGLDLESMNSSILAEGEDLREGIRAFFEKRKPIFPSTLIK